jgi:hypothetical protein
MQAAPFPLQVWGNHGIIPQSPVENHFFCCSSLEGGLDKKDNIVH